jgi:type I restriction enzyme S subunit
MYYLLGSMKDEFVRRANGSTFLEISGSVLAAIEVSVPSLVEQRAIASVLGALDDKIESNQRAVKLIEELLKLEFQRVVATNEIGEAPLSDLVSVVKGVSYKSVDLKPSRTSLVTLKSFDRTGGYKVNGLKPYAGPFKPQQVVQPGELVIAQTDLTQGAEVIGRGVRVPEDASADVLVASLDLVIVRPSGDLTQEYLQGIVTDESFREYCRSRTSGTTVLHLASDAIPTYEAPLVPLEAQRAYSDFARPLIQRADSLNRESVILAQSRDNLLTGLISGDIHVGAVEAMRA